MREINYEEFRARVADDYALKALHGCDARVGGVSFVQALEMSAACDRWLASRGIRTRSVWRDLQMQKRNKK